MKQSIQLPKTAQTTTIGCPAPGLRVKNDIKKRAAEVKRQAVKAQVEAARLIAKTQQVENALHQVEAKTRQVENALHQVEETAKTLHAKIRKPEAVKT